MTATDDSDKSSDQNSGSKNTSFAVIHLPPGDRSLAGTMQEGGDFMSAQLAGVDLTEGDFYWASFHNARLERAILVRCDLRGAIFNGANLRHADLSRANAGNDNLGGSTHFVGADLSGADLRFAELSGANCGLQRLQGWFNDDDFFEGAYIDRDSTTNQLELTVYDSSRTAVAGCLQ